MVTPTVERRRKMTLRRLFAMLTGQAQARLRTEQAEETEAPQAESQESVAA